MNQRGRELRHLLSNWHGGFISLVLFVTEPKEDKSQPSAPVFFSRERSTAFSCLAKSCYGGRAVKGLRKLPGHTTAVDNKMAGASESSLPEKKPVPIARADSGNGNGSSDNDEMRADKNGTKQRRTSSSGLTLEQKKTNHIMSENRRRNQIRSSFDRLVELVPQLDSTESRSEYAILTKTANYIVQLRKENERLEQLKQDQAL